MKDYGSRHKAGAFRAAAQHNLVLVIPDTSPRGAGAAKGQPNAGCRAEGRSACIEDTYGDASHSLIPFGKSGMDVFALFLECV